MFILKKEKNSLDNNLIIKKAMISMNTHNLASSSGKSGEGKGFLVYGTIDDIPYIYVVISFEHTNDIYEPDEPVISESDIEDSWHEGIVFLEDLGFYLDDIDIVSIKEDFNIFKELNSKRESGYISGVSDKETNEIIDFLASF